MANPSKAYEAWLDALNQRRWNRFDEILAPGAKFTFTHRLPSEDALLRGRATISKSFRDWVSGFESLTGEITGTITEGSKSAIELWWVGTTEQGSPVEFASCHLIEVEGSKIVEIIDYFDTKTYDKQVGR